MVLGECYRSSDRFVKTTTKYKEKPTGIKIELPNDIVLNSNVILLHISAAPNEDIVQNQLT